MSEVSKVRRARRKIVAAVAVAALSVGVVPASHAITFAAASYEVTDGAGVPGTGQCFSDPASGPCPDTPFGPSYPDVLFFGSIPTPGLPGSVDVGIHTGGNTSTFVSRSTGQINGTDSGYHVDGEFNGEFAATGPSFTFNIIPGQVMAAGDPSGGLSPTDFWYARIDVEITSDLDGLLFQTSAEARVDVLGAMVGLGGTDIGYACNLTPGAAPVAGTLARCAIPHFSDTLAVTTGAIVTYNITSVAQGQVAAQVNGFGEIVGGECGFGVDSEIDIDIDDDIGFELAEEDGEVDRRDAPGAGGACRSAAQIGDPIAFSAVPEPSTVAMAALGLVAMRRARKAIKAA